MSISTGARLGPYEILGPIGAGGMGEVYRARDERLKRDVAIKVLPASYSQDADRLRRFEQEAQAAGALNHPNITAVYDLGAHGGAPYIVTELLEGETLRARLAGGALPVRKAIDVAVQIARGLAAAHEKGIIHRDLKPENLFLTKDGRVKILDFGLAKLTLIEGSGGQQTNLPTASAGTEAGVVMGTLGYMSPEQVKGQPADPRSDLFSFGAILYEMLSGSRAFHRGSAAETISAILREDPPDLSATNRNVQPGLERIVRHCLEKNPEERFYSARDLAFDLEALSSLSGAAEAAAGTAVARARPSRRLLAGAIVVAALAGAGLTWIAVRRSGDRTPPAFHQLTFRRGIIWNARFGSDGKTVVYAAAWDGGVNEIHVGRTDGPDARPFGLKSADVLAVGRSGDVAVALDSKFSGSFTRVGTLARAAETGGGAPREVLENVEFADFSPDGREHAVVRVEKGRRRLEYPVGKLLYETSGWIGNPRVSPRGDRVAFLDHPVVGDDGGAVAVVDLAGKKKSLTPLFASANGLAWSPEASEIWFAAADVGGNRSLRAVTLSGRSRVLAAGPGAFTLQDVSRDGRALVSHDFIPHRPRREGAGRARESATSRGSTGASSPISPRTGGRRSSRSRARPAAPGIPSTSAEPTARPQSDSARVRLSRSRPTGSASSPSCSRRPTVGSPSIRPAPAGRNCSRSDLSSSRGAAWLPDGRRFLMTAAEPGQPTRRLSRRRRRRRPEARDARRFPFRNPRRVRAGRPAVHRAGPGPEGLLVLPRGRHARARPGDFAG